MPSFDLFLSQWIQDLDEAALLLDAQRLILAINPPMQRLFGAQQADPPSPACPFNPQAYPLPGLAAWLESAEEDAPWQQQTAWGGAQFHWQAEKLAAEGGRWQRTLLRARPLAAPNGPPAARQHKLDPADFGEILAELRTLEHRFRAIFENSGIGIAQVDPEGRFMQANQRFCEIIGYTQDELRQIHCDSLAPPEDASAFRQRLDALAQGNAPNDHFEARFVRRGGERIWLDLSAVLIKEEPASHTGSLDAVLWLAADITEQKWAEEAEHMLRLTAEDLAASLQEAILREQQVNEISELISGNLDASIILQNVVRLAAQAAGAAAGLIHYQRKPDQPAEVFSFSLVHEAVDPFTPPGSPLWALLGAEPLLSQVADPQPEDPHARLLALLLPAGVTSLVSAPLGAWQERVGTLVLFSFDPEAPFEERDLALLQSVGRVAGVAIKNARLYEEVQRLARHDPLTGVYNRRYFFDLAGEELKRSQRYQAPVCVVMLDIDHFKRVNDTHGHAAGDQVLQEVARRCTQELRSVDRVARYGGEEFVFLMPETPLEGGRIAAERLRQRIAAESIPVRDGLVFVTASLGVTGVETVLHNLGVEALLSQADQAMYQAKQTGRNRVCVWQESFLENQ